MANWASVANVGDPLSAGWQEQNLQWIEPIKGQRWRVYKPAATAFQGFLNDLIKLGYHPTSAEGTGGGFNYRNIRGGNKLSQHAFGTAIDLNSMTNPMGQSATDIPHAAELAKKWGLEWGGNWKNRPDPMHFEYTGTDTGGQQGQGPAMPTATQDYSPEQRRNAIASIESQGSGDYKALGPVTNRQGDRAYGRYQVMGSSIPAWTKQALGTEMTPDQFLASPEAQDKVFDAIYGGYVQKHGERGAASMWFTGQPNEPDVKDMLGTTGKGYVDKYIAALGEPGVSTPTGQGGTTTAAGGNVDLAALAKLYGAKTADRKTPGEVLGGAIANMGASPGEVGLGQAPNLPQIAPTILPAMPTIDPQQAEQRRQMLAMAMQRLNQGVLA